MTAPTLALASLLAQVRIPPDLIGPLIFGVIFVSTWVWNAYQRGLKRRRDALAKQTAGLSPRDSQPGRMPEPHASSARANPPRASAARPMPQPRSEEALSMRDRIERARAEAAAAGRSPGQRTAGRPTSGPAPRPGQPPFRDTAAARQGAPRPPARSLAPAPFAQAREVPRAMAPSLSTPAPAIKSVAHAAATAAVSAQGVALDAESMRRAIVTMEVLLPPVALRKEEEASR